jgi:hypothetical protein
MDNIIDLPKINVTMPNTDEKWFIDWKFFVMLSINTEHVIVHSDSLISDKVETSFTTWRPIFLLNAHLTLTLWSNKYVIIR